MTTLKALSMVLDPARAVLVVVDIQERLAAAMPSSRLQEVAKTVRVLAELARRFEIPVVLTEQYPKGLGATLTDIESSLLPLGSRLHRLEKIEFSACAAPGFQTLWDQLERDQWIVVGMETHVCVYQSVRQLIGRGAQVFVPVDGVVSRTEENREVGLDLMRRCGAINTSRETLVFDVLGKAGTDDFKALSKLIK